MNWLLWCLLSTAPAPDPVLAIAGTDTLRRARFQLQLAIDGVYDVSPENIQPLLETWIDGMLLYREAGRRGLGQDETTLVLIAEVAKDYIVGLMTRRVSDTVKVSDNEIFDYYNRHKLDFVTQLRLQYMALPDEKAARQAMSDLKRPGVKFKTLARERSLDRAANPEAELTLGGRNDTTAGLDPLLEDTIFTLPVGKLSPPLKAGGQFWLVEVLDKEGRVIKPFTRSKCTPIRSDKTSQPVKWGRQADLSALVGQPVRFRFHLQGGRLYSFWVSPERSGASHGYVAAGGPGFTGTTDTVGGR